MYGLSKYRWIAGLRCAKFKNEDSLILLVLNFGEWQSFYLAELGEAPSAPSLCDRPALPSSSISLSPTSKVLPLSSWRG